MDDLDSRLRHLRPSGSDRNRPMPDRAEQHLRRLLANELPSHRPRSLFLSAFAALVAVAVFMVVAIRFDGGSAYALTPPPLEYESANEEVGDVIRNAFTSLERQPGPERSRRASHHLGWFAQIDMDSTSRAPVAIRPEITDLTWYEDLSATQTITAAEPYWADPSSDGSLLDVAAVPGTVISETTYGPGEFTVPSAMIPGESSQDMAALLMSLGLSSVDAGAGDIMESIDSAMGLWTLTNRQHSALLQLLLDAGDLTVLGTASDRIGRPVIGLRAEPKSFPGTARVILLSAETGRIVGIETVRTTDEPPLKAGDVVAYKLWEVPQ